LPESGSNLEPKNHRSSCCCAGTGRGVPRILPGGCTFLADLAPPPLIWIRNRIRIKISSWIRIVV
jgi:hypothetical protein